MDIFDPQKRSEVMSRVRGKDTKPELRVRRYLHAAGLRYVLHDKNLSGKPDLVFRSRRIVIFVHGCFWHGHEGCNRATIPATRTDFWRDKIGKNRSRDARVRSKLETAGWEVVEVWECSLGPLDLEELAQRIRIRGTTADQPGR